MDNHPPPPPPPYSKTDRVSSAGPTTSTTFAQQDHRSLSNASSNPPHPNDRSLASSATASVIYTPPESPGGSVHHSGTRESDHILPSLDAFFDSRPFPNITYETPLVHDISMTPNSEASDLPFPQPENLWLSRGLTRQDWVTFIKYLIPNHRRTSNAQASDRKTKADLIDGRMNQLSLRDDREREKGELDVQLTSSQNVKPKSTNIDESEARKHIDRVLLDWNVRFFGPRGLQVQNSTFTPPSRLRETTPSMPANPISENNSQKGCRDNHSNDGKHWFHAHGHERSHEYPCLSRERGRLQGRHPNHDRSSSSSSSSSNSSSSSEESVGSLVDYDRVPDEGLSVAKRSLTEWLNHPDQLITKDAVSQLNNNIRHAPVQPVEEGRSIKEVRKELKALMKQFKGLKKAQKRERRALKREKRTAKRAERRQAKANRREARRTRKAEKHGKGRAMHDSSSSSSDGQGLAGRSGGRRDRIAPSVPGTGPAQNPSVDIYEIVASANRMQVEANTIGAGANRIQVEINHMTAHANMPGMDETGRTRMLFIAERLKETHEILRKEKEVLDTEVRRLMSGEGSWTSGR